MKRYIIILLILLFIPSVISQQSLSDDSPRKIVFIRVDDDTGSGFISSGATNVQIPGKWDGAQSQIIQTQLDGLIRITGFEVTPIILEQGLSPNQDFRDFVENELQTGNVPDEVYQILLEETGKQIFSQNSRLINLWGSNKRDDWKRYQELASFVGFLNEDENDEFSRLRKSFSDEDKETLKALDLVEVKIEEIIYDLDFQVLATSVGRDPIRLDVQKLLEDEGIFLDPLRDASIIVLQKPNTFGGAVASADPKSGQIFLGRNSDLIESDEALVHEMGHMELVDGNFYCDQYNYRAWTKTNERLIGLNKGGCPNDYDPMGCCVDNPRWHQDVPYENIEDWKPPIFLEEEYRAHLDKVGLGWECLPKDWKDKKECVENMYEDEEVY